MITERSAKPEQKNREQSSGHAAARTGDAEKIVKRTVVKEEKADCEKEQIKALLDNIMFFYPSLHVHYQRIMEDNPTTSFLVSQVILDISQLLKHHSTEAYK